MFRPNTKSIALLIGIFLLVWVILRFIFPLLLPFLLGAGLAMVAEPLVRFCEKKLRFPRGLAAGLGTGLTLLLFFGILVIAGSLLVKELTLLASVVPDLTETARNGLLLLEDFLLNLTGKMPEGVRPLLTQTVLNLFSSGTAIMDRITARIPAMASALLTRVPNGALIIGTAILSGFMVSARLPNLRLWLKERLHTSRLSRYTATLKRVRHALGGWLKAQLKLSGLSFGLLCAGLLLLGIPYAPIWAFLIALVDAIPILGTGTVLLPWSLICLLQQNTFRALGLVILFGASLIARTTLEPRLVGKQLGLDPLVTLIALYAGYRIWGIPGMLLAPLLSVAALEISAFPRG